MVGSNEQYSNPEGVKNPSRRSFLTGGILALFFGAYLGKSKIANFLGESIDATFLDTDSYGSNKYYPLVPEKTFETGFEPTKEYEEQIVDISLEKNPNGKLEVTLPTSILSAVGEHSLKFYVDKNENETTDPFTETGWSTITTRNGINNGQQEYCALFENQNGTMIGIGFEGGIYAFNNNQKYWERLKISNHNPHVKILSNNNLWSKITKHHSREPGLISNQTEIANKKLSEVDYKPAPGVKPTVKNPWPSARKFKQSNQLGSVDEAIQSIGQMKTIVTESGAIVDIKHIYGSIVQTISVFLQLLHAYKNHNGSDEIEVASPQYAGGEKCYITMGVDINNVTKDMIPSLIFHLMNTASQELETTTQRGISDNMPISIGFIEKLYDSGFSPDDLYGNTIGITHAIKYITNNFMDQVLNTLTDQELNTPEEIFLYYEAKITPLINEIYEEAINNLGVRNDIDLSKIENAPLGVQPFIPNLATDDVRTPAELNIDNLNLNPENFSIKTKVVPVVEYSLLKLSGKLP